MKVKYSVIPFIPAFLATLILKVMSIAGVDGSGKFLGMDNVTITYLVIGITLGLFVICILINLFDRKTAPVYPVKKNIPAGMLAVLTGILIMSYSITTAVDAWQFDYNFEYKLLAGACAAFSVVAGVALALISRVHFAGKNVVSSLSVLYVFPSLWGCCEMVNEFLQATKSSVYSKDLTGLFCYIFISLFFFSSSMVVSRIQGRNPVKGVFIYGLPMASIAFSYGIFRLIQIGREGFSAVNIDNVLTSNSQTIEGFPYAAIINAIMLIACALYALAFIVEMFSNTYTKDDIEIVTGLPDENDDSSNGDTGKKKYPQASPRPLNPQRQRRL